MPRKAARKTANKKVKRLAEEALAKGKGNGKGKGTCKAKRSSREPFAARELVNERADESRFVKEAKRLLQSKAQSVARKAGGAVVKFQPGSLVTLTGLKAAPELNGQSATCLSWDVDKTRWLVRVAGGTRKLVRTQNLHIGGAPASGSPPVSESPPASESPPEARVCSPAINQSVIALWEDEKPARLLQFIKTVRVEEKAGTRPLSLTIVFCNKLKTLQNVVSLLNQSQFQCSPLHAESKQAKRDRALSDFKLEHKRILVVAGDVASGLQREDVRCIVNYDFPPSLDEYCRRADQLTHHGKNGTYATFFGSDSAPLADSLVALLDRSKIRVDPNLRKLVTGKDKAPQG